MKIVKEEILCAGFGGQGIMFMGKLLAETGLSAGYNVTWMPSYGAEVRGGTAYSMTTISDREIASPVVINPNILVAMNKPSFIKYEGSVKIGGIVIVNKSLVGDFQKRKGIRYISIPLTEMAVKLGDVRCANVIASGAVAKASDMVSIKNMTLALKTMLKGKDKLFPLNKEALEKGYKHG
jgi:2-oxoglutarate ferredoxin oxidoreductase subunit gamma